MLNGLHGLGATVLYSDERSGYALVKIAREKVLDTLDLASVVYAFTRDDDRDYYQDPAAKIPQSERRAEPVPSIAIPYPRVTTLLSLDGPYFPAEEIGLAELRKGHPEADGRGVRIAVPDQGFDLLHPALQQAKNREGAIVPKISDLGTVTSPDEDSAWVQFGPLIETTNGGFEATGRSWVVPQDGAYRFGIFKQDLVLGPEHNSRSKKLALSVGVLWDQQRKKVWVDTDGDGNFKNQRALGDYALTHDIDWFGAKRGDDDNRIPFGIKIEAAQNAVYIRIGGEHGAFVGGPLAGNKWTGGLFDGAAPSAQLVDSSSYSDSYLAEIVKVFARPDVDVINRSGGLGRAAFTGIRRGIEDFAQHVVEREIAVYDKPIAAYTAAIGGIQVNDYAGPEMLRRNRQIGPPYRDTINSFVWWLPNGMVNTVVAPSASIETDSRYMPQDITWEDGKRHNFSDNSFNPPAPDGYVIGSNASPTIPVVSGILADLISEAKREHIRYNALRLNNAIFTGARLLEGIPASQQGYGLVNAEQSWNQLTKMAKADDPSNPQLTFFTFAQTKHRKSIQVQGFQTEFDNAGETVESEIEITRHGGYPGPRRYTFALRGDSASFTLLDHEGSLKDGKPVRVRFRTNGASGWNIAFLELRDVKADVVMQDVPLSVRIPERSQEISPSVDKYESTIAPLTSQFRYIHVGEDVQAGRYVMKLPYTGPGSISTRWFPGGRYTTTQQVGEQVDAAHHVGPVETLESLVLNDEPGTKEIFWENRGRPEYATIYDGPSPDVPILAELTLSKYAVEITRANDSLTVANKLAAVAGRTELYDASLRSEPLTGTGLHAMGETERTLPEGVARWRMRLTGELTQSPADVYLFNCTAKDGHCYVAATEEITPAMKTVVIDRPSAGTWKIVVWSREQVKQPVTYSIAEARLTPAGAPIETTDAEHPSGASWTLHLPRKQGDVQYAAFRIAGTPGVESEKNGLVIGMTPLEADAP
jgi:hypothetical protein